MPWIGATRVAGAASCQNRGVPPRFAYWTILIDNAPTAFRARDREELLPTLTQLRRTNRNAELKWFAQGRLWDSPEAQRASWEKPRAPGERRDREWRPGGAHRDPRARFDKEAQRRKKREQRAEWNAKPRPPRDGPPRSDAARRDRDKLGPLRPPSQRAGGPGADRPWKDRSPRDRNAGGGAWKPKPVPGGARKPWSGKPRGDRPWTGKPAGGPPKGDRPWQTKPTGPRAERKPWRHKPAGAPQRRDDEPPDKDQ